MSSKHFFSKKMRQELFSVAYIEAIVSAAGYLVSRPSCDVNSGDIDVKLRLNETSDNDSICYESLKIQVKCTYDHHPETDGYIHYPLPIKNYKELRGKRAIPAILVVLCIPSENELEWLIESPQSMTMHNIACWKSLRLEPPVPNDNNRTVLIDAKQRFDVEGLRGIMNLLAQGEMP